MKLLYRSSVFYLLLAVSSVMAMASEQAEFSIFLVLNFGKKAILTTMKVYPGFVPSEKAVAL